MWWADEVLMMIWFWVAVDAMSNQLINNDMRNISHCRWAMKFQNLEPNDVLLSSKDRPKLPLIFYVKECLSPALSAAKPISFERVFLILTSVPVTHCETHNFFHNTQKMNCFLPSIWGFAQAFFFSCGSWIFFQSE